MQTLAFSPHHGSGRTLFAAASDRQYVMSCDLGGTWHLLLWTFSDAQAWQNHSVDLSAFLGR